MKQLNIKNLKAAKRYAKALIDLGENEVIKSDLEAVFNAIFENEEFKMFFSHPVISLFDKKDTMKQIFEGKVHGEILNLLYVLLDNNRLSLLPEIKEVFNEEFENAKNILRGEVQSVIELNDEQKAQLKEKLSQKLNKQVELDFEINKAIVAGLVIRLKDSVIDLSLKTKFDKLKKA